MSFVRHATVLANAVASALRSFAVQPNELPPTPARVWGLIDGYERRRAD